MSEHNNNQHANEFALEKKYYKFYRALTNQKEKGRNSETNCKELLAKILKK